jgi:uncharacterized protein (UPF0548 family)
MRFRTSNTARSATFECDRWAQFDPNTTREDISRGGFVHDRYEAAFEGDYAQAEDSLLTYRIFAPHRMHARVCTEDHRVTVGATIIQRVMIGPFSVESAVRVVELDRSPDRTYFAYATLRGHAERGIASFGITRLAEIVRFEAEAWSRAGNWITWIGRPISRALQRGITREAVAVFAATASKSPGSAD